MNISLRTLRPLPVLLLTPALCLLASATPRAQLNVQWVSFQQDASKLALAANAVSSATDDVDFAMGDLDQDGWVDLVAVRKPPGSAYGKRPNLLLMNESGVLTDRTAQYASATDVAGDAGFLTPTGDRDVAVADVTGDGWLDVITVVSLSEGESKVLSHPRIYVNLQDDAGGAWLGLRFEDARVPQLLSKTGLAVGPRFIDVGVGDVDLDGDLDLHFVDHDVTTTGIGEISSWDFNDRLLVNDGSGYFTDATNSHMTTTQVFSAFGIGSVITDMNGDGAPEIVRGSANGTPQDVFVEYNDPASPGFFQTYGEQGLQVSSPYAFDVGDLNNDGRPDIVQEDDGGDRYVFNLSNDALNKVVWGPLKTFSFAAGFDDGFGGNTYIQDLDLDGWNDVLIADYDIDAFGCERRTHIYHNLAGPVGSQVTLKEEAEFSSSSSGWKGVVGLVPLDLKGTYDIALADFDRDGDTDMLLGRCAGSFYWKNLTDPIHCQTDIGFAGPGNVELTICGDALTTAGSVATLQLAGAAPNQLAYMPIGLVNDPTPLQGGTLVPTPWIFIVDFLLTDATGALSLPVPGGAGAPQTLYIQAVVKNGAVWEFSNALELVLGL